MEWTKKIAVALVPFLWRVLILYLTVGMTTGLILYRFAPTAGEGKGDLIVAITDSVFALSISVAVAICAAILIVRLRSKGLEGEGTLTKDPEFGQGLRRRFSVNIAALSLKGAIGCFIVALFLFGLSEVTAAAGGISLFPDLVPILDRFTVIVGALSAAALVMFLAASWQKREIAVAEP